MSGRRPAEVDLDHCCQMARCTMRVRAPEGRPRARQSAYDANDPARAAALRCCDQRKRVRRARAR